MSEDLWRDIDDKLAALVLAEMGPGNPSGYADLLIPGASSIVVGHQIDPDHLVLPGCLIVGDQVIYDDVYPHGDGAVHLGRIIYRYSLNAFTKNSDYNTARQNAKVLLRRLRKILRDHYALDGLTASNGEFVVETYPTQGRASVYGKGGVNRGEYLAVAILDMEIIAEV